MLAADMRGEGGSSSSASEPIGWLIDRAELYTPIRVIDRDNPTPSPVARRINDMVSVARAKYGDDPLFEALLNEVACLCFLTAPMQGSDRATAPPEGWNDLTPRERQVAGLLVAGKSDREVGAILGIAPCTATSHAKAVLAKLELHCRHELRYLLRSSPIGGGNPGRDGGY